MRFRRVLDRIGEVLTFHYVGIAFICRVVLNAFMAKTKGRLLFVHSNAVKNIFQL